MEDNIILICIIKNQVRKDIYLELYPETGHGKATKNKGADAASFTVDTANKTGKSNARLRLQ